MFQTNYLLTFLLALVLFIVFYIKWKHAYWTRKGVRQFEPAWLFGDIKPLFFGKKSYGGLSTDFYNKLKRERLPFGGMYLFTKPVFIPVDLQLIKRILVTDFQHFNSHDQPVNEELDPLSGHLFNLEGSKWKNMRTKLTPTFTSGKIKMLFNTILTATENMRELVESYAVSGEVVNIKDIAARFTLDSIGSCAFGLDFNCIRNPESEFRTYAQKLVNDLKALQFRTLALLFFPRFLTNLVGLKQIRTDIETFILKVVEDTVKYREDNNVIKKDFMHLLLQLRNKGKVTDEDDFKSTDVGSQEFSLNVREMAAQTFIFFLAGFETSSTMVTHTLLELCQYPDIQDKVRQEINDVLEEHNGEITYEAIKDMTYLDKVVNETFRKHPPLMVLPRACTQEYKIPGTDIVIEKGTSLHIPILAIHTDPEYYPDPEKFDPERFSDENKAKRPAMTFMPFGEGPRICIGLRFGVLQGKIALVSLLKDYSVTINKKTKLPIELDPDTFAIKSIKGGLWLNISKI